MAKRNDLLIGPAFAPWGVGYGGQADRPHFPEVRRCRNETIS